MAAEDRLGSAPCWEDLPKDAPPIVPWQQWREQNLKDKFDEKTETVLESYYRLRKKMSLGLVDNTCLDEFNRQVPDEIFDQPNVVEAFTKITNSLN